MPHDVGRSDRATSESGAPTAGAPDVPITEVPDVVTTAETIGATQVAVALATIAESVGATNVVATATTFGGTRGVVLSGVVRSGVVRLEMTAPMGDVTLPAEVATVTRSAGAGRCSRPSGPSCPTPRSVRA